MVNVSGRRMLGWSLQVKFNVKVVKNNNSHKKTLSHKIYPLHALSARENFLLKSSSYRYATDIYVIYNYKLTI